MTSPIEALEARLSAGETLTLDAGTGTELQARGVPMHPTVWCGVAHMTHPDTCRSIHIDYINAGADIITTNTFSTNRNMMGPAGLGEESVANTRQAVKLALEARSLAGADRPIAVAGSMSHQVPVMRGTDQRNQRQVPNSQTARNNFTEMADTLASAGVDFIMLEMMSDPDLAILAVEAAENTGLPVWVGMSCKLDDSRELVSHARPELPFEPVVKDILDTGGRVAGIMHNHIITVVPALEIIRRNFSGPLMAYPDSGSFTMPDWVFEEIISPADFAKEAKNWRAAGAQVIGGCCGLSVDHIHALHG